MMNKITYYLLSVSLLFVAISMGCEKASQNISVEDCDGYDYYDCDTWEPSYSYVFIDFTINNENIKVPFEIYKGKLEEGNLVYSDTAVTEKDSVKMDFDTEYTVKAKYNRGGQTIYAIDMDKPIKWSQDICDSVCWHYIDAEVDLRLR